ncbi:MAG: hypothetical protein N2558_04240 [Patescibacteria group bacterium]|nr:hypothetical protein [Patescibacteria group bacterium]
MENLTNIGNSALDSDKKNIYNYDSQNIENIFITSTNKSGQNKLEFFIIGFTVLVAIVFWIIVCYLYLNNRNLKENIVKLQNLNNSTISRKQSEKLVTPLSEQISIAGGNIVRKNDKGELTILINKNDYPLTGIIGFLQVSVSYDNNLMCFESRSPAKKPALYIANVDGQNAVEVSHEKVNCLWAKSSKAIFYTDTPIFINPVDIYMYDIATKTETNLTKLLNSGFNQSIKQYQLISISDDGIIYCSFKEFNKQGEEINSKNCKIDMSGETPAYYEN